MVPSERRGDFLIGGSKEYHAVIIVSKLAHTVRAPSVSSQDAFKRTLAMPCVNPTSWAKDENSWSLNSRFSYCFSEFGIGISLFSVKAFINGKIKMS